MPRHLNITTLDEIVGWVSVSTGPLRQLVDLGAPDAGAQRQHNLERGRPHSSSCLSSTEERAVDPVASASPRGAGSAVVEHAKVWGVLSFPTTERETP